MNILNEHKQGLKSPDFSENLSFGHNKWPSHFDTVNIDSYQRLLVHFQNETRPKAVLSANGTVLIANEAMKGLCAEGLLSLRVDGQLDYGSPDLNASAQEILNDIIKGRTQCRKFLKRMADNEWMGLEFLKVENSKTQEILLTVKCGNPREAEGLNALSEAFDFTITESIVVGHMSKAYCPKEIAAQMDISVNTVRAHLRSIYSKTGVRGFNRTLRLILQLQA